VDIYKSSTSQGYAVKLNFKISQHSRDVVLMKSLVNCFNCGIYYSSSDG